MGSGKASIPAKRNCMNKGPQSTGSWALYRNCKKSDAAEVDGLRELVAWDKAEEKKAIVKTFVFILKAVRSHLMVLSRIIQLLQSAM